MGTATYKKMSRALVIALVVAVALVSYDLGIPEGKSSASNWKFVVTHPTIFLHVIVAVGIVVTAIIMLIMSVRSRNRSWIIMSAAGLGFVLLAFASGDDYVATLRRSADDYMGVGWFGAIITYATDWYQATPTHRPVGRP
jgi:hypothetical protein